MRKAFSQINEKKCDVEKQMKVGCFFTDMIHSNLKTSRKDCGEPILRSNWRLSHRRAVRKHLLTISGT